MKRPTGKAKYGSMERWLITYADMITLLLIFFIVMYTISRVDIQKFQHLAESLSRVMGGGTMVFQELGPALTPGISGLEPQETLEDLADKAEMENIRRQLVSFLEKTGLAAKISVISEERGIVLSFQEEVLFKIGSAELTPQAKEIIAKIAPILMKTPNFIRIEGHTCDIPIHNALYKSNWELSSARALATVQELIRGSGFPPQRLAAVAYGEYRPRVPNDSEANRQQNRRVDIVILRSKYKGSEAGGAPAA
ncbi:MAG: flagellar motor protein MotB [Bacillota bacterium]